MRSYSYVYLKCGKSMPVNCAILPEKCHCHEELNADSRITLLQAVDSLPFFASAILLLMSRYKGEKSGDKISTAVFIDC